MREITVTVRCDLCDEVHPEDEFRVVQFGLDLEGDFCVHCWSRLKAKMRPAETYKKRKRPAPDPNGPYPCPKCEKDFARSNGLSRHLRQTHGVTGESVH